MRSNFSPFAALVLAVCTVACDTGPTDQQQYEPLYRAARAVDGAIAVGVSYEEFGALLQRLSTEVLVAADRAQTDSDKALVAAYTDVLATYKDSATIWKHRIDASKYESLYKGRIPVEAELEPLVAKYGMPTTELELYSGKTQRTIAGDSIQKVWDVGSEKADKAIRLYFQAR